MQKRTKITENYEKLSIYISVQIFTPILIQKKSLIYIEYFLYVLISRKSTSLNLNNNIFYESRRVPITYGKQY